MSKLLLVGLLAIIAQFGPSQAIDNCENNNAYCTYCKFIRKEPSECAQCFFQITMAYGACGEKIPIENCMVQEEGSTKCRLCVFGYTHGDDEKSCQKISIPNCFEAERKYKNGFGYQEECVTCQPGFALREDRSGCFPVYAEIIPNCAIYNHYNNAYSCKLCKEGYSIVIDDTNGNTSCIPSCLKGCATCRNSERKWCSRCNTYAGYFMYESGKCAYKGLPDGVLRPLNDGNSNSLTLNATSV